MQPVWAAAGNLSQLVTDRLSEELDYDEITTIKLCSVIPPPWIFLYFFEIIALFLQLSVKTIAFFLLFFPDYLEPSGSQ